MVVGVSSADPSIGGDIEGVVSELSRHRDQAYPVRSPEPPRAPRGRDLLIVTMPNAISTGLHAGFPLPLLRSDPDYWPLYVANLWFGTHRDSFSHLYEVIRNQRGYNYGDYSYIEHFEGRPFYQFPPPHHPRRQQCFSIWIRPVQHDYAHHILKAFTWELENFIRTGLSEEDFALARNKARVMYLNLAETTARLLGSRLDDAFYGMSQGYLDSYLTQIEAVSRERVNAAVRKYLDAAGLRFVIVTDDEHAPRLADEIASGGPAWGKSLGDYQVASRERDGRTVYELSEENLEMLRRDAAWAHYWLDIPRDRIRVVPSAKLFETAALPR
jgi:zinc protease